MRIVKYFSIVYIVTFTVILISGSPALGYELNEVRHVVVVAVSTLPNGSYVGVSADLYVRVVCPGNGHVYVETLPLSQIDLQASSRVAAIVASTIAGINFRSCDFYVSIRADAPIIGGPSASGVVAVAFAAALLRLPLNNSIVMTGMIMPDGSIGPVGGIKYKLDAAYSRAAKIFLVPYGQTVDYVYRVVQRRVGPIVIQEYEVVPIDLVEYGEKLGVKVIPISSVYEALEIFTNGLYKPRIDSEFLNNQINRVYDVVKPILYKWTRTLKQEIDDILINCSNIEKEVLNSIRLRYGIYTYQYVYNRLKALNSSIEVLLSRAENMEQLGNLYSAASMYFQALINAYTKLYIINAFKDSTFINEQAKDLENTIHVLIKEIHAIFKNSVDMMRLTIAINILDRAYEALIYLNRSLNANDIVSSASSLAYAMARLYTAKMWADLLELPMEIGTEVSAENIKSMAMYIDMLAQNIYVYIVSLAQANLIQLPKEVNEAKLRYDIAQKVPEDIDRLALSINSISHMYLALISTFSRSLEILLQVLNKTAYINLGSVGGDIPIDIVLYLELANSLSEDYESRAVMLSKISMMISLYKILLYTSTNYTKTSPPIQFTEVSRPLLTTLIPYTNISTVTVTSTITTTHTVTIYYGGEDVTHPLAIAMGILILLIVIALAIVITISRKLK